MPHPDCFPVRAPTWNTSLKWDFLLLSATHRDVSVTVHSANTTCKHLTTSMRTRDFLDGFAWLRFYRDPTLTSLLLFILPLQCFHTSVLNEWGSCRRSGLYFLLCYAWGDVDFDPVNVRRFLRGSGIALVGGSANRKKYIF